MGQILSGRGGGGGNQRGTRRPQNPTLDPKGFDGSVLVVEFTSNPNEFDNFGKRRWAVNVKALPGGGEFVYYMGYAQIKRMVALVGNDDEQWKGQRVGLVIEKVPDISEDAPEHATVDKFYAADPRQNAEILAAFDKQTGGDDKPARGGRKRA